jgi:hypothetical protein
MAADQEQQLQQLQVLRRQHSSTAAADFVRLWRSGACDEDAHAQLARVLQCCPLSGRMIHGFPDDLGFGHLLSADEWKRLSWVFGPEALSRFLGKSAREICLQLGFGERWLASELFRGRLFKLAIFPSDVADSRLATWDGVEHLLQRFYPEVWGSKVAPHWQRMCVPLPARSLPYYSSSSLNVHTNAFLEFSLTDRAFTYVAVVRPPSQTSSASLATACWR